MTAYDIDELGEDKGGATRWRIRHGRRIAPGGRRKPYRIGLPFGRTVFSPKNIHGLFEMLRQRRVALGMPQWQLTEKLGIGENTLARWETGAQCPTALKFFDWCDALDVKIEISPRPR